MNYPFIFLIGIIFYSQITFAQESNSSNEMEDSSWGLKLGASRHWQNEGDFSFASDLGYLGGMYFKKPHGRFIATSYEWQVMQMGYRIKETTIQNLEKIKIL